MCLYTVMIKVVIFDFDGTMFDTAPEIYKAVNATLKELHLQELSFAEVTQCIGQGLLHLIKSLNLKLDMNNPKEVEHITKTFRQHYDQTLLESKPYPGLVEFLNSTPHRVAVASNKDEKYLKRTLSGNPWNNFPWLAINGGNTFKTKKPEPEIIEDILRKADCAPKEAVIVGDGTPDIQVAGHTGIHSIAVSYGYSPVDELVALGANHVIDSLFELPSALSRL